MEVFQIPEDTVHLMTKERLEEFAETFTLDSCRLQNNLLHITGSQTGLDSAKKLYKGLKKKLFQFTTVTIPLPKTVGEEDLKELLENKVDVCFGKSSLKISGERQLVENAKSSVDYFLKAFVGESSSSNNRTIKEKSGSGPNNSSTGRHKWHACGFCGNQFSSKYLRKHFVKICDKAFAPELSFDQKDELLDMFYKARADYDRKIEEYSEQFSSKSSSIEEIKVATMDDQIEENSETNEIEPSFFAILDNYELYLNSRMGSQGLKNVTQCSRFNDLKRFVAKLKVSSYQQLLSKTSIIKLTERLDKLEVQEATRYDYCLAVKRFLEYFEVEEEWINSETKENIAKAIRRWEQCRTSYQAGLLKDRKKLKHKENQAMERGEFPRISDVADAEKYFRRKLPKIKTKTLDSKSLKLFYRWLGLAFSANNALRPSSVGNMRVSEYKEAYLRDDMKVVVVEGKSITNF